jgi:hypothetical protein
MGGRVRRWLGTGLGALVIILFLSLIPPWFIDYVLAATIGAAIAILTFTLWVYWLKSKAIKAHAKKAGDRKDDVTVALSQGGLSVMRGPVQARVGWETLKHVRQTEDDLYFGVSETGDIASIPKRAFVSPEAAEHFFAAARGHIEGEWKCGRCGYDLRGNRRGRCPECNGLA